MLVRQFQNGARALRSEIVSTLKQSALSIFEIDDIGATKFLDPDSRDQSQQLRRLRDSNAFLFASSCDLPGVDGIGRYFRSRCIIRVSSSVSFTFILYTFDDHFIKALRLVLLGPRAIDGSNKTKRSSSRARKFDVPELNSSILAFVATVVRIFYYPLVDISTILTRYTKLFFLLTDSPTSFSEEDIRFRTFFEKRYTSFDKIRTDTPAIFRETMKWLNTEVFVQLDDKGQMVDEEQLEFEEALNREIAKAKATALHLKRVAMGQSPPSDREPMD